jgi:small GTP-binding protein
MPDVSQPSILPQGFKLRHTFYGHERMINRLAWSPDGKLLASASHDATVRIWDLANGTLLRSLVGHTSTVYCVAWSPDGHRLASGSHDLTVRIWDVATGNQIQKLDGYRALISNVGWSPDGKLLTLSSQFIFTELWQTEHWTKYAVMSFGAGEPGQSFGKFVLAGSRGSGDIVLMRQQQEQTILGEQIGEHRLPITGLSWSNDGRWLASSSMDATARLWDAVTGQSKAVLEGHTKLVTCVDFSADDRLLATKSGDGTVRLWRMDTLECVATLAEPAYPAKLLLAGLSFHPHQPLLATLGEEDSVIRVWELDFDVLLKREPAVHTSQYVNAKVVLVGDTGVGKSGLAMVLAGQSWAATDSTHGRRVWTFDNDGAIELPDGRHETRETLLWDLAGQPDYRLIHQLHLNEVAVALVVFDSRGQTDPFAGVQHWVKALRQAQAMRQQLTKPIKLLLVAARVDVGRIGVSRQRIEEVKAELGFDEYIETSAKVGWGVDELAAAIRRAIAWDALPKVSSTDLFQNIKAFLLAEKSAERVLATLDDLYRAYCHTQPTSAGQDLRAEFETCVGRVEARGLIKQLSFGNFILLQPELLDVYSSALISAAKDEPDGLGSIYEEEALAGRFRMDAGERLANPELEKILLISTIEELLRHDIALRTPGDEGLLLVFPSQLTRENADLPDPEGKAVSFSFEGPPLSIYATLAVRLSHSGVFRQKEMWKNAATYRTRTGGICGMFMREVAEGKAELTLFFDAAASAEARVQFEEFVRAHLLRRALAASVRRRRIIMCPDCLTPVSDVAAQRRRERGFDWLNCNVCDKRLSLLEGDAQLLEGRTQKLAEMEQAADAQRERALAASLLQGKAAINQFDVFLCHNSKDKPAVKRLGERLKERGIRPWLDEWELRPGLPWQRLLEEQIRQIKAAAIFVGSEGIGPWQRQELDAFLREFVERGCPAIPVVLSDAPQQPELPLFLKGMSWVDFRKQEPDPFERLIWGITGERELPH